MKRRDFLSASGLLLLAAPWASAAPPEPLLRAWFWLRWEAASGQQAYLEYSGVQAAHGPLTVPASLKSVPTLNARPRAQGPLLAPLSWGKGPCLVCQGPLWKRSPRVIWVQARPDGWAYRVDAEGPWASDQRTLAAPEFEDRHFDPQNLGRLRSVLKANQEERGAFTSDSAGEMLDQDWRGKLALAVAPPDWTAQQFLISGTSPAEARVVAFLEIRFR